MLRSPALRRSLLLAGVGLLTLAGCKTQVQQTSAAPVMSAAPAPAPHVVYVTDFTIDPATVTLDQGMRLRLQRAMSQGNGAAERQKITAEVREAITETLVERINAMGLPARHVYSIPPGSRGDLVIRGQITEINAGNKTRRLVVGFGAGHSEVDANVDVLRVTPSGERPEVSYAASSTSGRAPGLALGAADLAAGSAAMAAASVAGGTVSRNRNGLSQEGVNLAQDVASKLKTYFWDRGWIAH